MISKEKIEEYIKEIEKFGVEETAKTHGVKKKTIQRYRQLFNKNISYLSKKILPKILILDIETTPLKAYIWRCGKQAVNYGQIIEEWLLLSWSAKWLYEDKMMSNVLTPKEIKEKDDSRITKTIWQLIEEADVIVAHNATGFDQKKLNSKFIYHKLSKPLPYQVIDTLTIARKVFGFTSNKLDSLLKLLKKERKMETNFQLWIDCLDGDEEALAKMRKYNEKDVLLLEDLYTLLRGWTPSHINTGLYSCSKETVCPVCGSNRLTWKDYYYTTVGKYASYRCSVCKAIGRSRFTALSKEEKKVLSTSVAR